MKSVVHMGFFSIKFFFVVLQNMFVPAKLKNLGKISRNLKKSPPSSMKCTISVVRFEKMLLKVGSPGFKKKEIEKKWVSPNMIFNLGNSLTSHKIKNCYFGQFLINGHFFLRKRQQILNVI